MITAPTANDSTPTVIARWNQLGISGSTTLLVQGDRRRRAISECEGEYMLVERRRRTAREVFLRGYERNTCGRTFTISLR